jgi:uncharacterized protein
VREESITKLVLRELEDKGRGVFAAARFICGEIIEMTPVIVIPAEQWPHIEPTVLALYIYNFGPTAEEEHAAIALGYGSLYNHSYTPNAKYIKNWDEQVIRFVALRDIEAGEEITINYNGSPEDKTPIWFEVRD